MSSSPPTGEGVVIDIGTGDGVFVYQSARRNPNKFYIGVDANPRPLEKVSEKIHRKLARGGLPNALFVQAAVEDLPPELDGVADEGEAPARGRQPAGVLRHRANISRLSRAPAPRTG